MSGCLAVVRFRSFSFLSTVIFPASFSHIHFSGQKFDFVHSSCWSGLVLFLYHHLDSFYGQGSEKVEGEGGERKAKGEMERRQRKDEGDRKEKRKETANEEVKEH